MGKFRSEDSEKGTIKKYASKRILQPINAKEGLINEISKNDIWYNSIVMRKNNG